MPVTTTLLQKLRETLGDEAANDLVTWVDEATARELGHIREMAELHYSRFDARLEQRLAELRADLCGRIDRQGAELSGRIDRQGAELSGRIDGQRTEFSGRFEELRTDLYSRIEEIRTELAIQRSDLIKWMFLFWVGTIVPLAGLMVALIKL
jgi:hypothetical protein